MKSRRWRYGVTLRFTLVLLVAAPMASGANAACPPGEADGAVIRKGDLTLAWRTVTDGDKAYAPRRIPMARHFALAVQLCDKDGIPAAHLHKADATMPEHRHGMNYRPVITPLGDGRFRVDGMMFHMAGRWELAFEVRSGKEVTRITHDVQID